MDRDFQETYRNFNQQQINEELIWASKTNDLDLMKFLLLSKEIAFNAQVDYKEDKEDALMWACINGNISIVKFLTQSPELPTHIEVLKEHFILASVNKNMEVVHYLVYDMNCPIESKEIEFLNRRLDSNRLILKEIIEMVEKREGFMQLNEALDEKTNSLNKKKI